MARSGVRYEDVQRAIDGLLARGESPSVQKVREWLGTGSFTTINDHLRDWRSRRQENRDRPAPRDMPEALQSLAVELWERAQATAAEGLAHYRDEADQQVRDAREAVAEARRQAEDAGQRESALATHLASTETRLEACSAALARSEAERDGVIEREARQTERLEQIEAELASLQEERTRETREHQQALATLEAQQRERLSREEQRHETAEARLMALLDEARQERQAAQKQHAARERQLSARLEALEAELQSARAAQTAAEKRHRETDWARSRAEEQVHTLHNEKALLQARIDEQKRGLEEQSRRLREVEKQLNHCLWQAPVPRREHGDEAREDASGTNEKGPAAAGPSKTAEE